MGLILQARCKCGFTSENLFLGGGMMSFGTHCAMPALCPTCHRLEVCNVLSERVRCSKCQGPVTFYTDKSLQSSMKTRRRPVFQWNLDDRKLVLPDVGFRCPACKKLTMRFLDSGRWD